VPPEALAGTIAVGILGVLRHERVAIGAGHLAPEDGGNLFIVKTRHKGFKHEVILRSAIGVDKNDKLAAGCRHRLIQDAARNIATGGNVVNIAGIFANLLKGSIS
jgi:hypothetical protein